MKEKMHTIFWEREKEEKREKFTCRAFTKNLKKVENTTASTLTMIIQNEIGGGKCEHIVIIGFWLKEWTSSSEESNNNKNNKKIRKNKIKHEEQAKLIS